MAFLYCIYKDWIPNSHFIHLLFINELIIHPGNNFIKLQVWTTKKYKQKDEKKVQDIEIEESLWVSWECKYYAKHVKKKNMQ